MKKLIKWIKDELSYIKDEQRFFGFWGGIWKALEYRVPFRQLDAFYWFIMHRTFYRYHIVKTDLKPGFYEVDTRMLYSNFKLLEEYYLHGYETIEWNVDNEKTRNAGSKIIELYSWWKNIYPSYEKKESELFDKVHVVRDLAEKDDIYQKQVDDIYTEIMNLEKTREEDITNKLIELIKIRTYLWS